MDITRVGVVGGGLMGSGITEVGARAGLSVVTVEVDDDAAKRAADRVESSLRRAEQRGKLTVDEVTATLERITFTADLTLPHRYGQARGAGLDNLTPTFDR